MDFKLSEDALMLREMLRKFIEKEAKPLEMSYFSAGSLTPEENARLRRALDQMGVWGLTAPEAFGGGGLDAVTTCVLEEELGKTFLPLELGDVPPLLYACQGEQTAQYLEPALAGERRAFLAAREPAGLNPAEWRLQVSLCPSPTGEGERYQLNGVKILARQPRREDFIILLAKFPAAPVDEVGGEAEMGVTAFLVDADAPGIEFRPDRTADAGCQTLMILQNCTLSQASVLGMVGKALKATSEAPIDRWALNAWIAVSARYLGLAERLVTMATEYARSWVSLGAPLANRPGVQSLLAEAQIQLDCVRWLVYYTAWLADEAQAAPSAKGSSAEHSLRFYTAEARLATAEMLKKVSELVAMVYGGPGPGFSETTPAGGQPIPLDEMQAALTAARRFISLSSLVAGLDGARRMIARELLQE